MNRPASAARREAGDEVGPDTSPDRSEAAASGIARAAIVGGIIGFVLVTLGVWAVVAVAGGGKGSIGAGLVAGWFGGIGFGAMEGATAYANRHPDG